MKIVFLEMKSLARNLRENRVLYFKSISIDMFNFFLILTLVVAFNSFKIQKTEIINLFLLYFFFITLLSTNTELHKDMFRHKQTQLFFLYPLGYRKSLSYKMKKCSIVGIYGIMEQLFFSFLSIGLVYGFSDLYIYLILCALEIYSLYQIKVYISLWQIQTGNNMILWIITQVVTFSMIIQMNKIQKITSIFKCLNENLYFLITFLIGILLILKILLKAIVLFILQKSICKKDKEKIKIYDHLNKLTVQIKEKIANIRNYKKKETINKILIYFFMTLVSISVISAMKKENSLILIIWVSCIETEIALVNQLIKNDSDKKIIERYWLSGISISDILKCRCEYYIKFLFFLNSVIVVYVGVINNTDWYKVIISYLHIVLCVISFAIISLVNNNYCESKFISKKKYLKLYNRWNMTQSIFFCLILINPSSNLRKYFLIYQIIVILVLILYLHKDRKSLWGEYIDVLEN